ncbi:UPF0606 protein KIAA1549L [Heptranchias perlo]|uniref:UPF0606 protein KIAA1549L n=1 Tax=Heptranchias perlo TaxID=212740 RepID=UPI0035593720
MLMAAGILGRGFAPGLSLALAAVFLGNMGGCRSQARTWVQVMGGPHLQLCTSLLNAGMVAKCIGVCIVLLLQPVSATNGPGMIYQLLDLSTPLPPSVQRSLGTSNLSPVWPWTSQPLRWRALSSYAQSSSDAETLITESVDEIITVKSSSLAFQLPPTPETNKNAATSAKTTLRATASPQLSLDTETYKTRRDSEFLTSTPADEEVVRSHPAEASSGLTPNPIISASSRPSPTSSAATAETPSETSPITAVYASGSTNSPGFPYSFSSLRTVSPHSSRVGYEGTHSTVMTTTVPLVPTAKTESALLSTFSDLPSSDPARSTSNVTVTSPQSGSALTTASPLTTSDGTKAAPPSELPPTSSSPATVSAGVMITTDPEAAEATAASVDSWPTPLATSFNQTTGVIGETTAADATSRPPPASSATSMPSPQIPVTSGASSVTTVPRPVRTTVATRSAQPLATVTADTASRTNPGTEMGKTSMAPPLTLTAALTSISTTAALATRGTQASAHMTTAAKGTAGTSVGSSTSPSLTCRLSDRLWVRTVVTLSSRRIRTDTMLKQNMTRGLTQALKRAFFDNDIQAQIESLERRNKVFIGFYAVSGSEVYIPSAITEAITTYGVENLTRDLERHVPDLQSVLVSASPWVPLPARWFQLKTVLQFVSTTDIIKFCSFVQTMEARLRRAFEEAESRASNSKSNLSVQILNTSVTDGSTAVTMVYMVRNQSTLLNGTMSSSLLHHLTAAELGYYLAYPPLILAEPLEYENLDTSPATEKYWVVTVILGVDNTSLGEKYQRFASLMEQRLANLLVAAQQQGRRFKRASTIGTYTVQLVSIKRLPGPKNPAELTYYALENGGALLGTTAAKILNTVDPQTMALELGYRVQLQAEPVVKNPPNNLWIIAAVLAPVGVVTVIIIIISTVLCRKNKSEFKSETMSNLHQRAKPVQGFDYAKQHIGQHGGEDEVTITQETVVLPLPGRDPVVPHEREISQDGSNTKPPKTIDIRRSRLHSEQDSVISDQSGNLDSGTTTPQKTTAQQKITKEGTRKRNVLVSDEEEGATLFEHVSKTSDDPFDTSSGSVQLLSIKPLSAHPGYSQPGLERSPDTAAVNGEVNKALKQKSDIEHYRNKLRLKAKRKGYYDFPEVENNQPMTEKERKVYEKGQMEINRVLEAETQVSSTFTESRNRQSQAKNAIYRSRQSLNSPSPGGTEMDLLVTRERSRRGIRNSGYDTEPELIEETNVDRITEPRTTARPRQAKGHSETSTLSSQPSIDEVRQHMHQLLEEAFSLASAGRAAHGRHQLRCPASQPLPYTELVTSAPGTMSRSRGGLQWVPAYGQDMCQYSLPRPAYRYSQLPEMSVGSPPPVPPRNAPVAVTSLRRSTSENGNNTRPADSHSAEQLHHEAPLVPVSRSSASAEQPVTHYSGSSVPAVYAIPANRPGFPNYFIPAPAPYRNHAWTPYVGDGEAQGVWAENVTLPGYVEAFSQARYPQSSPPRQYSQTQPSNPRQCIERAQTPSTPASQQSLAEYEPSETAYSNISTAALVKAIREEVAKLAKKQTGMFEFQV